MKNLLCIILVFCFVVSASAPLSAVGPKPEKKEVEISGKISKAEQKTLKKQQKQERKEAKLKVRLGKVKQKLKKKGLTKERAAGGVWDDSKFRLGAIFLLAAIGIAILREAGILSGLLGFIAGLFALAGIVLIIWSLIERYG